MDLARQARFIWVTAWWLEGFELAPGIQIFQVMGFLVFVFEDHFRQLCIMIIIFLNDVQ